MASSLAPTRGSVGAAATAGKIAGQLFGTDGIYREFNPLVERDRVINDEQQSPGFGFGFARRHKREQVSSEKVACSQRNAYYGIPRTASENGRATRNGRISGAPADIHAAAIFRLPALELYAFEHCVGAAKYRLRLADRHLPLAQEASFTIGVTLMLRLPVRATVVSWSISASGRKSARAFRVTVQAFRNFVIPSFLKTA